jgi:tetratricopeptide (TPR) repeat protein
VALKDYEGDLQDLDKAHVLDPNNAHTLTTRGDVKRALKDYEGALEDLDKAHVLDPNNAHTLTIHGNVKGGMEDYEGALEDLDKAHVLDPNNAFTLTIQAHVNWNLNNYDVALKTFDEVNVLQPNDYIILQTRKWLKWILDKYQPTIESLQCKSNIQAFTYNELKFQKCLGKGAFGEVYKSKWKNIEIAIKVLIRSGSHNEGAQKSFISEVLTLGSIQHTNLVRLLGYCIEGPKHVLVYEYMSNSSLDKWLLNDNLLDWDKRMCIIIGIAQGLAYLHHECNPTIVHLDINPQNILLDKNYTPKLGDFGLAKILDGSNENMVCAHDHFLNILLNMFIFSENVNLANLNDHVS